MPTEEVILTEEVRSPCISVCVLDENDICDGCYRSAQEITDWIELSIPQKKAVTPQILCC